MFCPKELSAKILRLHDLRARGNLMRVVSCDNRLRPTRCQRSSHASFARKFSKTVAAVRAYEPRCTEAWLRLFQFIFRRDQVREESACGKTKVTTISRNRNHGSERGQKG